MKISIIVPVYNAQLYIEKCLDSLIAQTYSNIEIICIDGGSEDHSVDILRRYAVKDKRIIVIQKCNEGVSLSRNCGLSKAIGDYVMFVDADDWIDEHSCEKAMKEIKKTDADVVMWSYVREFADSSQPKKIFEETYFCYDEEQVRQKLHRRFIGLLKEELKYVENADALCPVWGKLYKRQLLQDHQISFIDIREIGTYEDGMFNLETFYYAKKVTYMQEYFYHYRKNNVSSITSQYKEGLFTQWLRLFNRMELYISEKKLPDEYRVALNNRICLSVLGQGLNLLESREGFWEKYHKLKEIIRCPRYREAYKQFSLKYFSVHWKLFYGFAKYGITIGVYALLICVKKLIG